MSFKEGMVRLRKSPLARSLGGLLYNLVIYLGLVLLGWAAAGGLQGFFDHPARAVFIALLVLLEFLAAWIRWRVPEPDGHKATGWYGELTSERWRFLNQEMIFALAPFSDRQGIAVFHDSPWIRAAGLILFAAAGVWMLWASAVRRRHLQNAPVGSREPLLLMDGPFRRVRYPVLLGVLAASLAAALVFRSIGGVFLLVLMLATVLRRIRWMEADASRAVPLQWSAYTRHSWRLIPGIY